MPKRGAELLQIGAIMLIFVKFTIHSFFNPFFCKRVKHSQKGGKTCGKTFCIRRHTSSHVFSRIF